MWGAGIHYMTISNIEILDTNGVPVTASMEQFEAFDTILNNQSPTAAAELNMLNGGFLDLRDELGSRDVIIWGAGSCLYRSSPVPAMTRSTAALAMMSTTVIWAMMPSMAMKAMTSCLATKAMTNSMAGWATIFW